MKNIDINTSHNIVVNFALAPTMSRILATLLDIAVMGVLMTIIVVSMFWSGLLQELLIGLIVTFYHLISEITMQGQSLGKKAMRIKVISINGGTPSVYAIYMRWVFRIIDVTGSLGVLAIITTLSTKYSQRIGDQLAQTVVIKVDGKQDVSLSALLALNSKGNQVMYPTVVQFTDQDMMVVKDILNRYTRDPNNEDVRQLRNTLVRDLADRLGVTTKNLTVIPFLKQVLTDYVYLTR